MSLFDEAYKSLNSAQKQAVDAIDGPVMVIAGPGTGKTQMLTLRIANILKQTDTTPDSILALSFTESGVYAMRERLRTIIGEDAYRVAIHTFHGFCNSLIERYGEEFPEIIGARSLDEVGKMLLIREALERSDVALLRPIGDPLFHLRSIAKGISDAKREYVSPDALHTYAEESLRALLADPDSFHQKGKYAGEMKGVVKTRRKKLEKHQELAIIYRAYESLRRERRLYDYDDMIVEALRALETRPDFLLTLQEEYQYLLADEHQDTNTAQNKLLRLLASYHDSPNIFVVGDPGQAIYRFQGASVQNFLSFTTEYPTATIVRLEENYRSTQAILDAIEPLSDSDPKMNGGALHSQAPLPGDLPRILVSPDRTSELAAIGSSILDDLKNGELAEEIAVLYRRNQDGETISYALEKMGIPVVIESRSNALADPLMRDFISLIRLLAHFGDDRYVAEALHAPFLQISPLDVYKLLTHARRTRTSLLDLLKTREELVRGNIDAIEQCLLLLERCTRWKEYEHSLGVLEALERVAHESGFLEALIGSVDHAEKLESYRALYTLAENLSEEEASFEGWIRRLSLIETYGIALGGGNPITRTSNRVRLMTVHRAKGLEFNRVYVSGATENRFEGSRSHEDFPGIFEIAGGVHALESKEDDERRLFYVALSRARTSLTISYATLSETGKNVLPTSFLSRIPKERVAFKEVDGKEGETLFLTAPPPHKVRSLSAEKEYLRTLFVEQGLSVTALGTYLKDPWEYVYGNLLRIPAHPEVHQLFGTAIHSAFDQLTRAYVRGELPSEEAFIQYYRSALHALDIPDAIAKRVLDRGMTALSGYYRERRSEWEGRKGENLQSEFPIATPLTLSDIVVPLRGKIDLLEEISPDHYRITDYKTGAPKTRNEIEGLTKSGDGNYKRQLVFYKLLLALDHKILDEGVLEFVEPDERGKYHREVFVITDQEVAELTKEIERVSREILSLAFWDLEPLPDNPYVDLVRALKKV